ncbi:MAG TPA: alpha-isopropylmalate synthase regulatory domain-containing protein, partial [Actinomycetes bacterium]
ELLVRRESGTFEPPFTLEGYRVLVERKSDGSDVSEATVRLLVDGERVLAVGEGVGPVHALDQALRRALTPRHPELKDVSLVDYKVRILDGRAGTRAVTRVLVTSADPHAEWTTVGVSDDIVTASWEALADGIHHGLLRARKPARVA